MAPVLMQLTLAPEIFSKAKARADKLMKAHEAEITDLYREVETTASPKNMDTLERRMVRLHERGRKISVQNVVRAAVDAGLKALNDDALLHAVATKGVARGRPSRGE